MIIDEELVEALAQEIWSWHPDTIEAELIGDFDWLSDEYKERYRQLARKTLEFLETYPKRRDLL